MKVYHRNGRPFRRPRSLHRTWVMYWEPPDDFYYQELLRPVTDTDVKALMTGEIGQIDGMINIITSPLKG